MVDLTLGNGHTGWTIYALRGFGLTLILAANNHGVDSIEEIPWYCLKLRKSAKTVMDYYNSVIKPAGITITQFLFLTQLGAHNECSVTELAKACELDSSTMTRNLKLLLRQGLVANVKEAGTRNSKLVLTDQGRQVRREARRLWQQAQDTFREKQGAEGVDALLNALLRLQDR